MNKMKLNISARIMKFMLFILFILFGLPSAQTKIGFNFAPRFRKI